MPLRLSADHGSGPFTSPWPSPLRVLDLFAGAGGLSEGFHQASSRFQVARAVEMSLPAAASYVQNFGDVAYAGSIQDWFKEEAIPRADIVLGGPPCQGFSTLGKRSADDIRNTLWEYYASTVRQAQPLYFVMENVPQFLKSNQYPLLVNQTQPGGPLEDYAIEARILNAAHFGAPQARKRVIVIGHRRDVPAPRFPEPTHLESTSWRTVAEAWYGIEQGIDTFRPEKRHIEFNGRRLIGAYRSSELHLSRDYRDISLRRFAAIPPGGSRKDLPWELQMDCWREHTSGSMDVMGRLDWHQPSVTLRTEFTKPEKGRYLHPVEDRAISIHEGARLQGFRDDYKFVGSLTEITKQIGNAVPVQLAQALGKHISDLFY